MAVIGCGEPTVLLGPGIKAPDAPRQSAIDLERLVFGQFELSTRADFRIRGKLLSKRRYRWDDLAEVAPWDFALGWGVASDEAALGRARVAQGDRFMFWHLYDAPLNLRSVEQSSANVHLIPADGEVLAAMEAASEGTIVELSGQLVDVQFPDGSVIPTSLSRRDVGPGACEILLVHAMQTVDAG